MSLPPGGSPKAAPRPRSGRRRAREPKNGPWGAQKRTLGEPKIGPKGLRRSFMAKTLAFNVIQ